ncbi:hypothetical protein HDU76_003296 [Blyttiomyces sp. JEL0837]|nr:hypothetical protein HDU76_003296 [Blyttiomyces sp. JEL0837]
MAYSVFGMVATGLESIPVFNCFFLFSNIVGAALWAADLEESGLGPSVDQVLVAVTSTGESAVALPVISDVIKTKTNCPTMISETFDEEEGLQSLKLAPENKSSDKGIKKLLIEEVVDKTAQPKVHSVDDTEHENEDVKYKFRWAETAKFPGFTSKDFQALLFKWGMQDHCYLKRFTYDQYLESYELHQFILNFFNDPNVNPHIRVLGSRDIWGSLGKVKKVEMEETLHNITSLTFFDRLTTTAGVVRSDGSIKKCLDEYHDGFLVADELRRCLLMPEFESYDCFSKEERREFIFHIFKALCLGGRLCQYEDDIEPYLDTTKKLYKDLIAVTKDPATGKLKVASYVFKILSVESSVSPLFPIAHPQNFCYICVDPIKRHVNLLYHASDVYY